MAPSSLVLLLLAAGAASQIIIVPPTPPAPSVLLPFLTITEPVPGTLLQAGTAVTVAYDYTNIDQFTTLWFRVAIVELSVEPLSGTPEQRKTIATNVLPPGLNTGSSAPAPGPSSPSGPIALVPGPFKGFIRPQLPSTLWSGKYQLQVFLNNTVVNPIAAVPIKVQQAASLVGKPKSKLTLSSPLAGDVFKPGSRAVLRWTSENILSTVSLGVNITTQSGSVTTIHWTSPIRLVNNGFASLPLPSTLQSGNTYSLTLFTMTGDSMVAASVGPLTFLQGRELIPGSLQVLNATSGAALPVVSSFPTAPAGATDLMVRWQGIEVDRDANMALLVCSDATQLFRLGADDARGQLFWIASAGLQTSPGTADSDAENCRLLRSFGLDSSDVTVSPPANDGSVTYSLPVQLPWAVPPSSGGAASYFMAVALIPATFFELFSPPWTVRTAYRPSSSALRTAVASKNTDTSISHGKWTVASALFKVAGASDKSKVSLSIASPVGGTVKVSDGARVVVEWKSLGLAEGDEITLDILPLPSALTSRSLTPQSVEAITPRASVNITLTACSSYGIGACEGNVFWRVATTVTVPNSSPRVPSGSTLAILPGDYICRLKVAAAPRLAALTSVITVFDPNVWQDPLDGPGMPLLHTLRVSTDAQSWVGQPGAGGVGSVVARAEEDALTLTYRVRVADSQKIRRMDQQLALIADCPGAPAPACVNIGINSFSAQMVRITARDFQVVKGCYNRYRLGLRAVPRSGSPATDIPDGERQAFSSFFTLFPSVGVLSVLSPGPTSTFNLGETISARVSAVAFLPGSTVVAELRQVYTTGPRAGQSRLLANTTALVSSGDVSISFGAAMSAWMSSAMDVEVLRDPAVGAGAWRVAAAATSAVGAQEKKGIRAVVVVFRPATVALVRALDNPAVELARSGLFDILANSQRLTAVGMGSTAGGLVVSNTIGQGTTFQAGSKVIIEWTYDEFPASAMASIVILNRVLSGADTTPVFVLGTGIPLRRGLAYATLPTLLNCSTPAISSAYRLAVVVSSASVLSEEAGTVLRTLPFTVSPPPSSIVLLPPLLGTASRLLTMSADEAASYSQAQSSDPSATKVTVGLGNLLTVRWLPYGGAQSAVVNITLLNACDGSINIPLAYHRTGGSVSLYLPTSVPLSSPVAECFFLRLAGDAPAVNPYPAARYSADSPRFAIAPPAASISIAPGLEGSAFILAAAESDVSTASNTDTVNVTFNADTLPAFPSLELEAYLQHGDDAFFNVALHNKQPSGLLMADAKVLSQLLMPSLFSSPAGLALLRHSPGRFFIRLKSKHYPSISSATPFFTVASHNLSLCVSRLDGVSPSSCWTRDSAALIFPTDAPPLTLTWVCFPEDCVNLGTVKIRIGVGNASI